METDDVRISIAGGALIVPASYLTPGRRFMTDLLCDLDECDEDGTLVCTHCQDLFCPDHMRGYMCIECDPEE